MITPLIAYRSLTSNIKRYVSLFLVCAFGVCICLSVLGTMNGMVTSLRNKARIYYGGDLMFLGGDNTVEFYNSIEHVENVKKYFSPDAIVTPRLDFDGSNALFFFEGVSANQRVLKGVDFIQEAPLFDTFNFIEGSYKNMPGTDGVIISQAIAQTLNIRVGDSVTLMITNVNGYRDTRQLILQGIFADSSLFGMYSSYFNLATLQSLLSVPAEYANRVCIFYPDNKFSRIDISRLQHTLEKVFNMHPQVKDKQEFYDVLYSGNHPNPYYGLLTLDTNLQDLRVLIEAMRIVIYFISVLLIAIIAVGIGSTYRVIVLKRSNEIGVYMSLGYSIPAIIRIFLVEVCFLVSAGFITGLASAFGVNVLLQAIDFTNIPAVDLFLTNNRLVPLITPAYIGIIFMSVFVTTLASVLFTIRTTVQINPVEALAVTE